ncbi:MAG: hypothetical protein JXQ90_02235 [Cyclobacteriaceae bacterium]
MNKYSNLLLVVIVGMMACQPSNSIESITTQELGKGIKQDSLFLGLKFGITQKEFFDHCWELNKQQIVSHGGDNLSVKYSFKDADDLDVDFNFYPDYDDGLAFKYNARFNYVAWAPWNKHLWADKLLMNIQPVLEKWYGGNEFVQIKINDKLKFYKIDGNRQIVLEIKDERFVQATFIDLIHYPPNFK